MKPIMLAATALLGLALAACEGPGPWTKDGVSPKRTAVDLADCRSQAQNDIRRDVNIDTDIAAGRKQDWDRSQTTQVHRSSDATVNNARSHDTVRACMEAKGYVPTGSGAPDGQPHLLGFIGM